LLLPLFMIFALLYYDCFAIVDPICCFWF
jgi:hypothetical protein